jgi:prevent-host-death family protein
MREQRVNSRDFQRRFGYWLDTVRAGETVIITGHGRDWAALLPVNEYEKMEKPNHDDDGNTDR